VLDDALKQAKILVVDDEAANVLLVERILDRAGYSKVVSTTDSRRALPLYRESEPDLVVLDLHMPHLSGFSVMEALAAVAPEDTYLPILVLTADVTAEAMHRALSMGARDFLVKPVDPIEVVLRVRNLLETRMLHVQLRDQRSLLEREVSKRTEELRANLERMTQMAEHRRALLSKMTNAELRAVMGDQAPAG
jgi:PleD family two-component response regulator